MSDLLISRQTDTQLKAILERAPQALLIIGDVGSGRRRLAEGLASRFLGITHDKISSYPYLRVVSKVDGKAISIDQMRELKSFLKLKLPGKSSGVRRYVIIESAESMGSDAQNSILKFIEEPPEDTLLILLVERESDVLPTIRSRCMLLRIVHPGKEVATTFAQKLYPSVPLSEITSAYALSGGRSGLFLGILSSKSHPLVEAISQAKSLLGASGFDKLLRVNELSKQKESLANLQFALNRVAQAGIESASAKSDQPQIKRWGRVLSALELFDVRLAANVNTKLALTELMLAL